MTAPPKPHGVATFDSATTMAGALARFLHGRDFPGLGQPRWLHPIVAAADFVPNPLRNWMFSVAGEGEGVRPAEVGGVDGDAIAAWLAGLYPQRPYPAVLLGSSNGALMHLGAALGIPWLPQTVLVPVRRERPADPDDAEESLNAGSPLGERLLAANPDLQLHHMHDPNQDRLMVRRMMYFRLKWRKLPEAYRRFLEVNLLPGGTMLVVDCRRSWATARIGDRHVFQHGAVGGAEEMEFHNGSPRVAALLARVGSGRRQWPPIPTDGRSPEAEWGFEPALLDDLDQLAHERGWKIVRLVFEDPEHVSPAIADLYRDWNHERGIAGDRLLVESFVLLEPYWCLRLGAVPFWMTFNMEPSAAWLQRYLDERPGFDEIRLTLFAHGADSVGLPPIERWESLAGRAKARGELVAVHRWAYPAHFAVFARYSRAVSRLQPHYELPPPLPLETGLAALARSSSIRVEPRA